MKTINIFLLMGLITFVACDKVKSDQKKLAGEWELFSYEFTNNSGLKYMLEASGTMSFSNFSGSTNDYSMDITYETGASNSYKIENGSMDIDDDGEYFVMHRINPNQSITSIENCRIIIITKTDLQILFSDENGAHKFTMEK